MTLSFRDGMTSDEWASYRRAQAACTALRAAFARIAEERTRLQRDLTKRGRGIGE